jgi:hypothetical protein
MDIYNLALRPNCLMTRNPLVFITGPRSLFFYEKLGGTLQDFVAAHGYVVLNPVLPFRGKLRPLALARFLESRQEKAFHFVLSHRTKNEFDEVFKKYPGSTFTFAEDFKKYFQDQNKTPNLGYRLHEVFCKLNGTEADDYSAVFPDKNVVLYDRFLDRCVDLAENEP